MEQQKFKKGDYIIATKPTLEPAGGIGLFNSSRHMVENKAYMDKPILIAAVTPEHIVYEGKILSGASRKWIISRYELEQRGFILADPELVKVLNQ